MFLIIILLHPDDMFPQVSLLDTPLFLTTGLPRVLTSSLLELTSMPRLAEAVIASLLRLYTSPRLR